ncbi:hairy/enhancer-of-split related with YRPW motif protein 2-like [Notothenia coriiceps]|uniref:Hairy/enhancer-of-split related with YRPW motif protein 2-like n=1 Tax=Notothenia coriiceps TaxID=8208 RepID=A0A6I9PA77_9TELE|nr:PREDICTED: hairy/enhancer-of-split related with YRPW motif protein 2-like [Notothenia coriiceps]
MKRPCEDSSSAESDLEENIDVGRECLYPGHMTASLMRSPTANTQVTARKKRRGVIEKRRRDRINSSLSELRRLVPSAFDKQGSGKLEKAEILQMTVDHLKLQATAGKGYFDAQALALDFLSLGFRECVTEVSRFLSSVEGLDPENPLKSRLLSHLSSHLHPQNHHHHLQYHQQPLPLSPPFFPHHLAAFRPPYGLNMGDGGHVLDVFQRNVTSSSPSSSSSSLLSLSTSFPIGFPILPPSSSSSSSIPLLSSTKPYRPWGTEVGAF